MEGIPIEDWLRGFDEEIEELVAQPFGAALLHTVGACYARRGQIWLGEHASWGSASWRQGQVLEFKETAHGVSTKVEAASAAYDAYKAASKMMVEPEPETETGPPVADIERTVSAEAEAAAAALTEQDAKKAAAVKEQEDGAKKMFAVMWKMTVIDVEKTLRTVIDLVLKDETVSAGGRRQVRENKDSSLASAHGMQV